MIERRGSLRTPPVALSGLLATLVITLVIATQALAHSGIESYVYLDIFDTVIEGQVEYPVADLGEVLGVSIPQDREGASIAVEEHLVEIHAYTAEHLRLGTPGDEWRIEFKGFEILEIANGTYAVFPFTVDRTFINGVPRRFDAAYDGIIESKPERAALLLIRTDFGSGTFANSEIPLLRYTAEVTNQPVDLGKSSLWVGFGSVIGLGVDHIRIGFDHILFIIALVLPSALVFRESRGWLPAEDFWAATWRVVKIATAFTVAHTVTLTLGGLGIVEIPPQVVEPIIAVSIALAALHNLRPIFFNREWTIAFGFGLFHGFGFAGLLSDLGLTQSRRVVSLLGFNLGIELGQIAIILLLFPALFLLRRTAPFLSVMKAASWGLVLVATGWFFDRLLELDLPIDSLMEPLFAWPRSGFAAVAVTGLAAGYYIIERRMGRLLPVSGAVGDMDRRTGPDER